MRLALRAALTGFGLVSILLASLDAHVATAGAQSSLPALPAGWPSTVQLGMGDGAGGASVMRSTASFGFRYQYLAGGVPGGWSTWNPNGAFVTYYIQDSINNGITPVFTYYMIRQSSPNSGLGDGDADYNNLQNQSTMTNYFNDVKLFFQRAGAFPNTMVVMHVEPDMWGFMEQRSSGDSAATVPAQVGSSSLPELAGLPNTVAGVAQAFVRLRNSYAPNVVLGYHVSVWGTGNDILYSKPDNATVSSLATRAANFYQSMQSAFDITFAEYSDRDAAFKQYVYGDNGASWWGSGDFGRNELFISTFVNQTGKRVVFWQIPVGNTRMRAENNTWDHYQDNHVEWLLDDASRANLNAYVQAGAVAFLFGRGADGATCFCDADNDGIQNPAPINGNTGMSLSADDDGGFFRDRAANYYRVGAMPLPGSGGTSPTNTPTATLTPASTLTPTATPTSTPSSGGTRTVTFDDLSNPNRPLNGQYPTGLIDWGSNVWYLSGPYGKFTTQSISFNGGGPTSAGFTFVSPATLVQLDAYNGGTASSTITFSCSGQPTRSVSLAAGQVSTISTGWGDACSAVTIGSSNGWDANFDNLVVSSSGSGATATPTPTQTPTAAPTRTPTPTSTPGAATQTLTFDDLSNPNRPLNGQYPSGVADWGTNIWYLSGPYGKFTTQSISFNGGGPTSASVTFLSPRRVLQLDAYNGGSGPSTISLTCAGQPTVSVSLAADHLSTIATGWSGACGSLTITSGNGWWTNFDNVVIQ